MLAIAFSLNYLGNLVYFSQQERDGFVEAIFTGFTVFKGMLKDGQIPNK